MTERLFQVSLPYACFGIVVGSGGTGIEAAPIGRWMPGKNGYQVVTWVKGKNGTVTAVPEGEKR